MVDRFPGTFASAIIRVVTIDAIHNIRLCFFRGSFRRGWQRSEAEQDPRRDPSQKAGALPYQSDSNLSFQELER